MRNTLETIALSDQHAILCADCGKRPAVVLEFLCGECDAAQCAPQTVAFELPAVAPACPCGSSEVLSDGLCGECIAEASAVIDERRAVWVRG